MSCRLARHRSKTKRTSRKLVKVVGTKSNWCQGLRNYPDLVTKVVAGIVKMVNNGEPSYSFTDFLTPLKQRLGSIQGSDEGNALLCAPRLLRPGLER
ncbi:hypothetical protein BKA81DRAFT_50910 [Phyllosticta paracitricarpa]